MKGWEEWKAGKNKRMRRMKCLGERKDEKKEIMGRMKGWEEKRM